MDTKGKHTPGPWSAEPMEDGCSVAYRINDASGYEVAVTSGRDSDGEEAANARLIAAAPDMLAALKEARDLLAGDLTGVEWKRACHAFVAKADAAIAKAEGR